MTLPGEMVIVVIATFAVSTMAAITGTGGEVPLLPVLVAARGGVGDAVPAYKLAQFVGSLSRVWFNRRELELRPVG